MRYLLCVSLLCYLVGLGFLQNEPRGSRYRLAFFVLGIVLAFLFASHFACVGLTGYGFNDAVLYHLCIGLKGAGLRDFVGLAAGIVLFLAVAVLGVGYAVFRARLFGIFAFRVRCARWFALLWALAAIALHPLLKDMVATLKGHSALLSLAQYYTAPAPLRPIAAPPNLVWIYLESLERTYFDEKLFPGLVPGLAQLEDESLSFTDIRQTFGTGWTIAGMVASQCGIPLTTMGPRESNILSNYPAFLPGAVCLGDLLRPLHYQLTFFSGTQLSFAGKGKFYRSHGFQDVLGFDEIKQDVPGGVGNGWGINDDTLFDLAEKKFAQLIQEDRPFAFLSLTVNTHHPGGTVSSFCHGLKYGDGGNAILNAVHCSDRVVTHFVRRLRDLDKKGRTLIVMSSDHLAMPNTATDLLQQGSRRDLLLFNWPGRIAPAVSNRPAFSFGEGVTALNLMGYDIKKLGLGRALVSEKRTLPEKLRDPDAVVESWLDEFKKFWEVPAYPKSIEVDPTTNALIINGTIYALPAMIQLAADGKLTHMYFDRFDTILSTSVKDERLREGTLIWIDKCATLKNWLHTDVPNETDICYWNQKKGNITPITARATAYKSVM